MAQRSQLPQRRQKTQATVPGFARYATIRVAVASWFSFRSAAVALIVTSYVPLGVPFFPGLVSSVTIWVPFAPGVIEQVAAVGTASQPRVTISKKPFTTTFAW
jgi:hypothetical protein